MSTLNLQTQPIAPVPASAGGRALMILREALERQKLCDESLDVDSILTYALENPTESVVDSLASAEIMSALDEVFGTKLPKEILNHKSLTTLDGLRRSLGLLEVRQTRKPPQRGV
jgi:acyl carrier protein